MDEHDAGEVIDEIVNNHPGAVQNSYEYDSYVEIYVKAKYPWRVIPKYLFGYAVKLLQKPHPRGEWEVVRSVDDCY